MFRPLIVAVMGVGLAALAGCDTASEAEPVPVVAPSVPPDVAAPMDAEQSADESAPPIATQPVADTQSNYQAPFPERTEMFVPPDRDPIAASSGGGDATEDRVQLKGFVNVDGPRVILAIDGDIAPLAEGGERHGVKVVAITPPKVVLEYGSAKWTASLE